MRTSAWALLVFPAVALADEPDRVEGVAGLGHYVAIGGPCTAEMAHETMPFDLAGRGLWRSGAAVLHAGVGLTTDVVLQERDDASCWSEAGSGSFPGSSTSGDRVGVGGVRMGAQGFARVGGSWAPFAFEIGALAMTEPLWGDAGTPVFPSLSFRFGPERTHVYLGVMDTIPIASEGGYARIGLAFTPARRLRMSLGTSIGPEVPMNDEEFLGVVMLDLGAAIAAWHDADLLLGLRTGLIPDPQESGMVSTPPIGVTAGIAWRI